VIKYANNIYYNVWGKILPDKSVNKRATLREISYEKHKDEFTDHLVIIGYGINGKNVALAAKNARIPYVIIELNASTVRDEKAKGEPILYGDAVKTDILNKVNIEKARVAVIAISDPDATKRILNNIINISTKVHTIIRTRFVQEMNEFYKLGADEVIPEEFETSIEIFTRVLHKYLVPKNEIDGFVRKIRNDNYVMLRPLHESKIESLGIDLPHVDIASLTVQKSNSEITGKKLSESLIRKKFGITIVAIKRKEQFLDHIEGDTEIFQDDILYVFGRPQNIYEFNQRIKS
jgi:CPA2 family monovalent cation:H+ antiporter-2